MGRRSDGGIFAFGSARHNYNLHPRSMVLNPNYHALERARETEREGEICTLITSRSKSPPTNLREHVKYHVPPHSEEQLAR